MGQDARPPGPDSEGQVPGDAWAIVAYLVSGILVWGGLGWLLDRWLHTQLFVVVGILLGAALATYLTYVRYGRAGSPPPSDRGTRSGERG